MNLQARSSKKLKGAIEIAEDGRALGNSGFEGDMCKQVYPIEEALRPFRGLPPYALFSNLLKGDFIGDYRGLLYRAFEGGY